MSRFAIAIYCDDIRHEVGNKLSFLGVYSQNMFVPSFPARLPKLCVAVWARTPESNPFKRLALKLYSNESVLMDQELPTVAWDEVPDPPPSVPLPGEDVESMHTVHFAIQLAPFNLDAAAILRLRVDTGNGVLKAGGLNIQLSSPSKANPTSGPRSSRKSRSRSSRAR